MQSPCHAGPSQRWHAEVISAEEYTFKSSLSGKCLELLDASLDEGAAVVQAACDGRQQQRLYVRQTRTERLEGLLLMIFEHSSLSLTIGGHWRRSRNARYRRL